MNKLVSSVMSRFARPALKVRQHSPAILFGAGVIGVGTTVVLACRATLKLEDTLAETKLKLDKIDAAAKLKDPDFNEDTQKKAQVAVYVSSGMKIVRLYAPAAVVGLASIGALTGAQVILNRRVAGLGAAYMAVQEAFDKYRSRVIEKYGVEDDIEFRHQFEDREYVEEAEDGSGPVVKTVRQPTDGSLSGYARLFDEHNHNWKRDPHGNLMFLSCQQNWANQMLQNRGHLFLNEVYDMLGFDRTQAGALVGWVWRKHEDDQVGDPYVDFGVLDGDRYSGQRFINGEERSVWLDFNVAGPIYKLLEKKI